MSAPPPGRDRSRVAELVGDARGELSEADEILEIAHPRFHRAVGREVGEQRKMPRNRCSSNSGTASTPTSRLRLPASNSRRVSASRVRTSLQTVVGRTRRHRGERSGDGGSRREAEDTAAAVTDRPATERCPSASSARSRS